MVEVVGHGSSSMVCSLQLESQVDRADAHQALADQHVATAFWRPGELDAQYLRQVRALSAQFDQWGVSHGTTNTPRIQGIISMVIPNTP